MWLVQVLGDTEKIQEGENVMSENKNNNNRVLVRLGARKLNENEANQVAGGANTTASVIFTNGGKDEMLDQ
jgi:hypothetical protein